MTIKITM